MFKSYSKILLCYHRYVFTWRYALFPWGWACCLTFTFTFSLQQNVFKIHFSIILIGVIPLCFATIKQLIQSICTTYIGNQKWHISTYRALIRPNFGLMTAQWAETCRRTFDYQYVLCLLTEWVALSLQHIHGLIHNFPDWSCKNRKTHHKAYRPLSPSK